LRWDSCRCSFLVFKLEMFKFCDKTSAAKQFLTATRSPFRFWFFFMSQTYCVSMLRQRLTICWSRFVWIGLRWLGLGVPTPPRVSRIAPSWSMAWQTCV
jgi:hypothetical protein